MNPRFILQPILLALPVCIPLVEFHWPLWVSAGHPIGLARGHQPLRLPAVAQGSDSVPEPGADDVMEGRLALLGGSRRAASSAIAFTCSSSSPAWKTWQLVAVCTGTVVAIAAAGVTAYTHRGGHHRCL